LVVRAVDDAREGRGARVIVFANHINGGLSEVR
jgi:hypothetical protein